MCIRELKVLYCCCTVSVVLQCVFNTCAVCIWYCCGVYSVLLWCIFSAVVVCFGTLTLLLSYNLFTDSSNYTYM